MKSLLSALCALLLVPSMSVAAQPGWITLYYNTSASPPAWQATGPTGESINITGSTTSGCQEIFNYEASAVPGTPVQVIGSQAPLSTSTPCTIPPHETGYAEFKNVFFDCRVGDNPIPCLVLDSQDVYTLRFYGQISSRGTGPTVLVQPKNPIPGVGVQFSASTILLSNVVSNGWVDGSPLTAIAPGIACVQFDTTYGPVTGNSIDMPECNGGDRWNGNTPYGILITGTYAFTHNKVSTINCHAVTQNCLQVGLGTASFPSYNNKYYVNASPTAAAADGIVSNGYNDEFDVAVQAGASGGYNRGVVFNVNAANNTVIDRGISGNTGNAVGDSGANDIVLGSTFFVPPKLSGDPAVPIEGQMWFNTTSHHLKAVINGAIIVIY